VSREDEAARQALRDLSHAAGTGGIDDERRMSGAPSAPGRKRSSPALILAGLLAVVVAVVAFAIWAQGRLS